MSEALSDDPPFVFLLPCEFSIRLESASTLGILFWVDIIHCYSGTLGFQAWWSVKEDGQGREQSARHHCRQRLKMFFFPCTALSVNRLGLCHGLVQLAPPDFLQEVISDLLPILNSFRGKVVKNMDPGGRSSGFEACLCLCDPGHGI